MIQYKSDIIDSTKTSPSENPSNQIFPMNFLEMFELDEIELKVIYAFQNFLEKLKNNSENISDLGFKNVLRNFESYCRNANHIPAFDFNDRSFLKVYNIIESGFNNHFLPDPFNLMLCSCLSIRIKDLKNELVHLSIEEDSKFEVFTEKAIDFFKLKSSAGSVCKSCIERPNLNHQDKFREIYINEFLAFEFYLKGLRNNLNEKKQEPISRVGDFKNYLNYSLFREFKTLGNIQLDLRYQDLPLSSQIEFLKELWKKAFGTESHFPVSDIYSKRSEKSSDGILEIFLDHSKVSSFNKADSLISLLSSWRLQIFKKCIIKELPDEEISVTIH